LKAGMTSIGSASRGVTLRHDVRTIQIHAMMQLSEHFGGTNQ
jgi:hypothetical protein